MPLHVTNGPYEALWIAPLFPGDLVDWALFAVW